METQLDQQLVSLITRLNQSIGDSLFIPLMIVIALFLSVKLIPWVTDMMVNSAAGLAGKHLGRQYRTLVINCSTNNPEVAMMIISLFLVAGAKRFGGIGTPLGSNFANIYLIFLVALGWALLRLAMRATGSLSSLVQLIRKERILVAWHLFMSLVMFLLSSTAFQIISNGQGKTQEPPTKLRLAVAAALCSLGVGIYLWKDAGLRKERPELFEDIDEEDHVASWADFALGTLGLCVCCFIMNVLFLAAATIYEVRLTALLGPAIFYLLHYFLGALVTSLPEMNVAVNNYEKVEAPDLNTALSSASASNMSNLVIAGAGCLIALFL